MAANSKALGSWGEEKAVEFLLAKGYRIRERNFRWARGEIDIVAEHGQVLVFVEVKTAQSQALGDPAAWVNRRKQAQIGRVALRYLQERQIENQDCRFDVIGILRLPGRVQIQHIENAFWLE